jgi:hypothetical protein
MSHPDDLLDGITAILAGRTIAGGAPIDPRLFKLYGVAVGDMDALRTAVRDSDGGKLVEVVKEACAASSKPYPPRNLGTLLRAMDDRKVVIKRTAGGAPGKWPELRPKLLARVEEIKAAHKQRAGCACGPERYCSRCRLSDTNALTGIVTANPELLKTFLKEESWSPLLNSKGEIKRGVDITPAIKILKNQVSMARRPPK